MADYFSYAHYCHSNGYQDLPGLQELPFEIDLLRLYFQRAYSPKRCCPHACNGINSGLKQSCSKDTFWEEALRTEEATTSVGFRWGDCREAFLPRNFTTSVGEYVPLGGSTAICAPVHKVSTPCQERADSRTLCIRGQVIGNKPQLKRSYRVVVVRRSVCRKAGATLPALA